jgi:hypothetical protein
VRIALYVIAGWLTLGALSVVRRVGKPSEPTSGAQAARTVLIVGAMVTTLILAAGRLH